MPAFYPMMPKLMTSHPYGGVDKGNFEFSKKKVSFVAYYLKGHFKTTILVKLFCSVMIIKANVVCARMLCYIYIEKTSWNVEKKRYQSARLVC